jgi:hypothetical protein
MLQEKTARSHCSEFNNRLLPDFLDLSGLSPLSIHFKS